MIDFSADPGYPQLKAFLIDSTGLSYYSSRDFDLQNRIARRLAKTGARDCCRYLTLLQEQPAELDFLMGELTIGETYFFRHEEQFSAIRDSVIPDLLERNQNSRKLHIWCAGCASGAEPYSISILLRRELGGQLAGWNVRIVGTDVNRNFLAQAQKAVYNEWAFRVTGPELRAQCFDPAGPGQWGLRSVYKEWVDFQYHNLVKHPFPAFCYHLNSFDLIVCRNVLIYFDPGAARQMVARFADALEPGGWLILGHAEGDPQGLPGFRTVTLPGAVVYQKVPAPEFEFIPLPEITPRPQPPSTAPAITPELLLELAGRSDWAQAHQLSRQARASLEPRLHYCAALVQLHLEQPEEALECLKRALYLDRNHVLSHYLTGQVQQGRGRGEEARRSFRNALRLLDGLPDDHFLGDGEQVTAAALREIIEAHLGLLA